MEFETGTKSKQVATVGIVVMLLAVACLVPLNEEGDTLIESDESDAFAWVPFLIGMLLVASLAYIVADITIDPNGDNEEELQEAAAYNMMSQIRNALAHDSAYASDETHLIGFTQSFFQRMGEVSAADMWSAGSSMDNDTILLDSRALEEYATFMLNRMNIINSIFEPFKDKTSSWGSSSTYDSMQVTITYGNTEVISDGETLVTYCLGTTVTSTANDRVYLYDGGDLQDGYIYATSSAQITSVETGQSYTLVAGYNSLSGIPNGVYELQTGRTYMGSMMQTYTSGYADVDPAVILKVGNDTIYIIDTENGMKAIRNGVTTDIYGITYNVKGGNKTESANLMIGLDFIETLFNASNRVFSQTLNAASAAWHIFDTAGEASILASPSSLIPNLENMDFTADQIYLIYMSALQQANTFFNAASDNFTAEDVLISEDSLDLICTGSIYSNSSKGNTIATGYFTPMCYLRDQAIVVGDTAFLQPGLAMMWEKETDGSYKASRLVILESGNYLSISSIEYRGETYSELGSGVTLKVTSLPNISGYKAEGTVDPDPTYADPWPIILMIVGGILVLLGYVTGFRLLTIIGVLIFIGGLLWFISSLSWMDLLKMTISGEVGY